MRDVVSAVEILPGSARLTRHYTSPVKDSKRRVAAAAAFSFSASDSVGDKSSTCFMSSILLVTIS